MLSRPLTALLLGIALAIAAPAAAQRHVMFANADRTHANDNGLVHIYIDGWGSLYPGGAVSIEDSKLRPYGTLEQYFRRNAAEWRALAAATRVPFEVGVDRGWPQVQDTLRARLVRRIDRLAQQGGARRTIVFLVHGFRVDDAEQDFVMMGERIRAQFPRMPLLLVHVHWDGMFTPLPDRNAPVRDIRALQGTWQQANYNAPLVGLQLRRIFEGIKDDLPIRIITHSLGGGVIAAAMWPRGDITRSDGRYANYSKQSGGASPFSFPPNADIRLGMIVPAIRGEAFSTIPAGRRPGGNYPLVVVGQNRYDPVVAGNNVVLGETSLAVDYSTYCRYVHQPYARDPAAVARQYEFSSWGRGTVSHDLKNYFRAQRIRGFLQLLFAPERPRDEASTECRLKELLIK